MLEKIISSYSKTEDKTQVVRIASSNYSGNRLQTAEKVDGARPPSIAISG